MSRFQWIALAVIGCILVLEMIQVFKKGSLNLQSGLRILVWAAAAIGIAFPDFVSQVARMIGIGRGADAVIYVVSLSFIATTFYFYSRYLRLQRQMTDLARYITIQEAKRPHVSGTEATKTES